MKNSILFYITKKENREYFQSILEEDLHSIYVDSIEELKASLKLDKEDVQVIISDVLLHKEDEGLQDIIIYYPVITFVDGIGEEIVSEAVHGEHTEIIAKDMPPVLVLRRIRNMMKLRHLLELKNVVKEVVWDLVENNLQSLNICKCSKCKHDVLALTLNNVKPKYVVTQRGELISKTEYLSKSMQLDLIAEIARAARVVKEHPRH